MLQNGFFKYFTKNAGERYRTIIVRISFRAFLVNRDNVGPFPNRWDFLSERDLLKRAVRIGAIASDVRLRTIGAIVSGPGALKFSKDFMDFRTLSTESIIELRRAEVQGGSSGKVEN